MRLAERNVRYVCGIFVLFLKILTSACDLRRHVHESMTTLYEQIWQVSLRNSQQSLIDMFPLRGRDEKFATKIPTSEYSRLFLGSYGNIRQHHFDILRLHNIFTPGNSWLIAQICHSVTGPLLSTERYQFQFVWYFIKCICQFMHP